MFHVLYSAFLPTVLDASVLASVGVLLLNRPKRIQLPTSTTEPPARSIVEDAGIDPFDIATSEEVSDGSPIDEDKFWAKVHRKKMIQTLVLSAGLAVACGRLGWSFWDKLENSNNLSIISSSSLVAFHAYLLVISAYSISITDVPTHWSLVVHISALSAIGFLSTLVKNILPAGPRLETSSLDPPAVRNILNWIIIVELAVVAALSSTIPHTPKLYFPPELVYQLSALETSAPKGRDNVIGEPHASVLSFLLFNYVTPVAMLGYNQTKSMEISDLPILTARMRSPFIFSAMRKVINSVKLSSWWRAKPGSGFELVYQLIVANKRGFAIQACLSVTIAGLFYVPAWFLQQFVHFLELTRNPTEYHDIDASWGWVYCAGLFISSSTVPIVAAQLWSVSVTTLQIPLRIQLNTMLFAKTLIRKDVASTASASSSNTQTPAATPVYGQASSDSSQADSKGAGTPAPEEEFSSKAQVHTLMTTDVDRVSGFHIYFHPLIDCPLEITVGMYFLYTLLGVSCFLGLGVAIILIPVNHYGSKIVVASQNNLMKARDERVSLMNEILGAIRMLKFMAWERNFEQRTMRIREKELKYQKQSYVIQILFSAIWDGTPAIMTLASFYHYAVIRQQDLKPSVAFTALAVFNELRYALNSLPETIVNVLQSMVSAGRIEKYMSTVDVSNAHSIKDQVLDPTIRLVSASISWPQQGTPSDSGPSTPYTPRARFTVSDLSAEFPKGELSLICGKLGSGKSLLLLALLGEADILAGQVIAPRTPPDTLAYLSTQIDLNESNWIVEGVCAYVPQTAWLQNESIQNNILFGLPLNEQRYQQTIEACALVPDFAIFEDGDQAEIGERGVNLSGGQKARVSLARAIYSRASILFLDDVLSAVDAHTASHLVNNCLCGPLIRGRTVVLVSHHIQLVVPGASYVVALDNGRVLFSGRQLDFVKSTIMQKICHSTHAEAQQTGEKEDTPVKVENEPNAQADLALEAAAENAPTTLPSGIAPVDALSQNASVVKAPRKLIEDESRAVGRVKKEIWMTYFAACGSYIYWIVFFVVMLGGSMAPIAQTGWLRYWSAHASEQDARGPLWYISIYAAINLAGMVVQTLRWYVLYGGSIRASSVLYKRLLEGILFTTVRFHDTISRGRLLNRFGKDFEGLDSKLADDLGHALVCALNVLVMLATITYVGGVWFFVGAMALVIFSYNTAKVYGQTSRDLRRLNSVTSSPLYSIYGEAIAGVTVIRAFGASTIFLREMFRRVDTNASPYHGSWSVNRWVSLRLTMVSGCVVTVSAVAIMLDKSVQASFAGFALSLAVGATYDLILFVRRFVGLEQSMIALERIEEFSVIPREGAEFVEPRPSPTWPEKGKIVVENLVIRYAPDLPKVLHDLTFEIDAGSKIGVLGRTGCGKSTLALSFFRFVEAAEGRILIDGMDISQVGLTDLRSRLTIIPQDPTILSGTIRSTLDIFGEYEDHEIFEALRRVHLLPSSDEPPPEAEDNVNMFQDLDSPVSEGGENFSAGEKQLMCMARAILKRSKVLFCDEATASVDYATDELISQTIRKEFANNTIVTIAHRLRTVIDYDKVMVLDKGRIAEYDEPSKLLADPTSKFYALCQSAGPQEFSTLKKMAELASQERQGSGSK